MTFLSSQVNFGPINTCYTCSLMPFLYLYVFCICEGFYVACNGCFNSSMRNQSTLGLSDTLIYLTYCSYIVLDGGVLLNSGLLSDNKGCCCHVDLEAFRTE